MAPAPRRDRDDFVRAAMAIIAEVGPDGLKVGRVCERLGVTTGSFYHHYDGLGVLLRDVLAAWRQETTRQVADALLDLESAEDAIAVLKRTAVGLPHAFEARVRSWALRDAAVAEAQASVDEERLTVLRSAISAVAPGADADDLALVGLTVLVGFQQARDVTDLAELERLMDRYEALILLSGAGPGRIGR